MSIDLAKAYSWVVAEVGADIPAEESMLRLIEQCAKAADHPDWDEFRQIPFDELMGLSSWLDELLRNEPPGVCLRGLWFGIFNPIYRGEPVADMYICGSTNFNDDPNDIEWAVEPEWWPANGYAGSEVLATIYRIAHREGGLGNDAEYPLCLAFGALAVRDLLRKKATEVFEVVGSVGVGVGFDSGDFLLVGRVTEDGMVPI